VGKTALASYAVGAGSGFLISAFAAVESEINLQYGGVHELLIPFLPLTGDLPAPQRQALGVAFGMETGPPPDRFLVGMSRCCAWSMTHSGSTPSRPWCWVS
jgi:hypothetical protein